jgi:hypothetical protein
MHPTGAIRYYVQGAFRGVKETPEVLEQQEEIIADLTAKVEDLVSEGTPRRPRHSASRRLVGDLSALVVEFEAEDPPPSLRSPSSRAARLPRPRAHRSRSAGPHDAQRGRRRAVGRHLPGSGTGVVVVLAVAAWWLSDSWRTLREEPHAVGRVDSGSRGWLRTTIGSWFAVCFIALVANMMTGEFWLWRSGGCHRLGCRPLIVRPLVRAVLHRVPHRVGA